MSSSRILVATLAAVLAGGCSSTGNLGLMTYGSANPGEILSTERSFEEIGPVEGRACRYFLLAVIPWGDSTPTAAMRNALAGSGGDAIINASVTTSLYGFVPIYNVFAFTCTSVKGTAVKFSS